MATVVWTGHLAFGMVSIPISLYAAARTETTRFTRLQRRTRIFAQEPGVSAAAPELKFENAIDLRKSGSAAHQNHGDFSSNGSGRSLEFDNRADEHSAAPHSQAVEYYRVRQVLQSDADGRAVARHELVKGYEYGPGQYVAIEPAEYEKAAVETSDTIDLFHFVKSNEVDPVYFERSYYVAPEIGGERAYALLLQAMRNQGSWGVARIGMHKREHILILRTTDKGIIAHTMFYANEVRKVPEFSTDAGLVRKPELTAAEGLIQGYFGSFEPEKFQDIYQQRLQDLIQTGLRKAPQSVKNENSRDRAIMPDLMEDLKRSLSQIQKNKAAKPAEENTVRSKPKAAQKKAPGRAGSVIQRTNSISKSRMTAR